MIQDQIKQAMSAEADRLLPPDRLAATAITRGRRVRRTRRVGLGVAIVSGIVAAAVLPGTLLTSGRQDPAVTPTPSPEDPGRRNSDPPYSSLPQGAPPRVPYTVGRIKDGGYLHDGDTRVRIAPGLRISVMSRVDGGWLVSRTDAQNKTVLGIKRPSGKFTAMAASAVGLAAVSPDGKRVLSRSGNATAGYASPSSTSPPVSGRHPRRSRKGAWSCSAGTTTVSGTSTPATTSRRTGRGCGNLARTRDSYRTPDTWSSSSTRTGWSGSPVGSVWRSSP